MTDAIQVSVTTETRENAEQISQALVESRLAACVQIVGPITSRYHWQGSIETAEEYLCLIKTRKELYDQLESAILDLHPYEVPEIIALPIVAASKNYLDWLMSETESA